MGPTEEGAEVGETSGLPPHDVAARVVPRIPPLGHTPTVPSEAAVAGEEVAQGAVAFVPLHVVNGGDGFERGVKRGDGGTRPVRKRLGADAVADALQFGVAMFAQKGAPLQVGGLRLAPQTLDVLQCVTHSSPYSTVRSPSEQ